MVERLAAIALPEAERAVVTEVPDDERAVDAEPVLGRVLLIVPELEFVAEGVVVAGRAVTVLGRDVVVVPVLGRAVTVLPR